MKQHCTRAKIRHVVGGLVTVFSGPRIGRLVDRHGKFQMFAFLVAGACVVIRMLTASGPRLD